MRRIHSMQGNDLAGLGLMLADAPGGIADEADEGGFPPVPLTIAHPGMDDSVDDLDLWHVNNKTRRHTQPFPSDSPNGAGSQILTCITNKLMVNGPVNTGFSVASVASTPPPVT